MEETYLPPVAYLSRGILIDKLGSPVDSKDLTLPHQKPEIKNHSLQGEIAFILTASGNLETNLPRDYLQEIEIKEEKS